MRRYRRHGSLVALAAVATLALAACGGSSGSTSGSSTTQSSKPIVIGTTDKPTSFDPAGSYDLPSWEIIYNTYQNLLRIPPGGNKPVSDAADCKFDTPTTYTCTLKDGLKFSNGDPLTAQDVKFSFDRVIKINDPNGPSTLLASMSSVAAPDQKTVTFTLKAPDATWPYVLTTGAGAIVDSKVFPATKLIADDKIIGSGPYKLTKYTAGQQAVLAKNADYKGPNPVKNSGVIVTYEDQASTLKQAIQSGDVDVAYRSLSPTDIQSLRGASGVSIVEGNGTEIRYLVFDVTVDPVKKAAVRQAIAYLIDRQAIATNVYNGTVQPLYSMVPQGLAGAAQSYQDLYGSSPDKAKAQQLLRSAGVTTPLALTIWWTPTHYGPSSGDEYTEIKRQLDASGLFKISLQQTEWQQYQKAYKAHQYAGYELGWFPDYPDADDYLAPFYVKGGFYGNGYDNTQIDALVAQEHASQNQSQREAIFKQIQDLAARDVPTIPIWQGKQVAAVRNGVHGVQDTFDPSFTFRFYLISKS